MIKLSGNPFSYFLLDVHVDQTELIYFCFFISGHEPSPPPPPPPPSENVHHHHHQQDEPPPPPPPPVPAEEPPDITSDYHLTPPEHEHHDQLPPREETGCSAFLRGWFVLSLSLSISYSCLIKLLK